MVNINVWSNNCVDIENESYQIANQDQMITFIDVLLKKIFYSGENICLEKASFDKEKGIANYEEINRWYFR